MWKQICGRQLCERCNVCFSPRTMLMWLKAVLKWSVHCFQSRRHASLGEMKEGSQEVSASLQSFLVSSFLFHWGGGGRALHTSCLVNNVLNQGERQTLPDQAAGRQWGSHLLNSCLREVLDAQPWDIDYLGLPEVLVWPERLVTLTIPDLYVVEILIFYFTGPFWGQQLNWIMLPGKWKLPEGASSNG